MKNNQNVILAIALSFMVILGWQYFIIGPQVERERLRQEAELARTQGAAPGTVTATQADGAPAAPTGAAPSAPATPGAPPATPGTPPAAPAAGPTVMTRDAALAASERVAIDTPSLKGSINLTGGRIDDLLLGDYHVTVESTSPLVELFSPVGSDHPYYADFGWVAPEGGPVVPAIDTVWTSDGGKLAPGQDVTLSWDNGAGLIFRRTFSVDNKYMFTVRQSVDNTTGAAVTLYPYGSVSRTGMPQVTGYYILHEGLIGYFNEERLEEVDYSTLDEEPVIQLAEETGGWLGITDKYWGAALIPPQGQAFNPAFFRYGAEAQPTYQAVYRGAAVNVPAEGSAGSDSLLFAGAKETLLFEEYEERYGIPQFRLMVDWGWFWFITQPLFKLIDWLYRFLGNFGLAILAVTVIVKAVFFPLANRSYASMSKMKKLQPKMVELQARHKDDRMALQQAMMSLYKEEKVNPIAGCWPILIQIPVFFALYKVLFVTIEMRHAPFFGWIKDLSAPDPTSVFNLFGLLPFDPPGFLMLGIWPILMGITMFVQMRMNPTPPDKTQAMIFNWMPVIFTFMLASFPAGLVIYWAWNNALSILQQGIIMRKHGVPIELFGNLKGVLGRSKPKNSPAE